jgi:hypothetical protein
VSQKLLASGPLPTSAGVLASMTARRSTDECGGPRATSPRRVFGSLLAVVVALSALAGHHGSPTTTRQRQTSSYTVGGVRTLVVTAHLGDVVVTGDSTDAVSVTQHVTFQGHAPMITHQLLAGTLSLTSHCPPSEFCSVGYDITVPRATAVRITDEVGTVRLGSLAGQVTVTVDAGQIDLNSLSGRVEALTRAGSIIGQNMSSARAHLRVSTGEIDVFFSTPPAAISAITDLGAVILHVPNTVAYDVATSAGVGHIGVSVTQDTAAPRTITTRTDVGSITIEPTP